MRLRQRVKKLEDKLERREQQIEDIIAVLAEVRRQLTCKHTRLNFIDVADFWGVHYYKKVCADCELVLKEYDSYEEWAKAKAKWMKAEAARLEKEAQNANRGAAAD